MSKIILFVFGVFFALPIAFIHITLDEGIRAGFQIVKEFFFGE